MSESTQPSMADDAGEWACTCGRWHPSSQASCQTGEQIVTVGEDWL